MSPFIWSLRYLLTKTADNMNHEENARLPSVDNFVEQYNIIISFGAINVPYNAAMCTKRK